MTVQLPLPGVWPRNMSRRDPIATLEEIQRDRFEATYAIELLLDRLAEKHGIGHKVIAKAVEGYVHSDLSTIRIVTGEHCKVQKPRRRTVPPRPARHPCPAEKESFPCTVTFSNARGKLATEQAQRRISAGPPVA